MIVLTTVAALLLACGNTNVEDGAAGTGEQVFRMHCVLCHGASGKLGFNGAKDLTTSTLSRAEMVARVRDGKGTMQAYKHVLSAKEIEAVVDHVRALGRKK